MYYVESAASFEAVVEIGITGLVGTLEVQIQDNQGAIVSGPTTAGIIEFPAASGFYQATLTAPAPPGQYSILWSDDGSFSANHVYGDDLTVLEEGAGVGLPPISPIDPGPGPQMPPCNSWTTNEDIAICCNADVGSDVDLFEEVGIAASQVLFELSARQFTGTCDKTVRPCYTKTPCGFQVLSRGHVVSHPYSWTGEDWGVACGCSPLSEIVLSGYPVREIITVKIDGAVLDEDEYYLANWRRLIRKNGAVWPSCQRLDLDDTEEGTWSVRYTYGQDPPWIGQMAARELACELYKDCRGDADCVLPNGITRIVRQNLTIERNAFSAWGRQEGIWRTGLPQVDLFLNTYNPAGLRRRPVFVTPGRRTFPQNV